MTSGKSQRLLFQIYLYVYYYLQDVYPKYVPPYQQFHPKRTCLGHPKRWGMMIPTWQMMNLQNHRLGPSGGSCFALKCPIQHHGERPFDLGRAMDMVAKTIVITMIFEGEVYFWHTQCCKDVLNRYGKQMQCFLTFQSGIFNLALPRKQPSKISKTYCIPYRHPGPPVEVRYNLDLSKYAPKDTANLRRISIAGCLQEQMTHLTWMSRVKVSRSMVIGSVGY